MAHNNEMSQKIIITPEDWTPFILSYCIKNVASICGQIRKIYSQALSFTTHYTHIQGIVLKCAYLTFQIKNVPYIVTLRDFKCNSKIYLNRKFSGAVKIGSGKNGKRNMYYIEVNDYIHKTTVKSCQSISLLFWFYITNQHAIIVTLYPFQVFPD